MSPDATEIAQPAAGATPAASEQAPQQAPVSNAQVSAKIAEWDRALFGPRAGGDGASDGKPAAGTADNPPADPAGVPSKEATAAHGADPDDDDGDETDAGAATAEGQPPDKKPQSRTARLHEEYKGQIDTLKAEHATTVTGLQAQLDDLRRQLDDATGRVSEDEQRRRATQAAFVEAFGDDAEYERLRRINDTSHVTGTYLTNEEAEQLARWTTTRTHADPLQRRYLAEARQMVERTNEEAAKRIRDAGEQFQQYLVAQTAPRAEKYGLDPEVIRTAEYGALIDHAVEVTTRRLSEQHAAALKERDDTISGLEADLRAAETAGLANATEPLPGGNSADVRVTAQRVFNPRLPLDQQWDAAFGSRQASVR